jgi:hypothetical protein
VYRKLRNFRAGIEGNISCLKRAYGLSLCSGASGNHWFPDGHYQESLAFTPSTEFVRRVSEILTPHIER